MGRKTVTIRVYPETRDLLKKEAGKRVKMWEKNPKGPKPWIADVAQEAVKK